MLVAFHNYLGYIKNWDFLLLLWLVVNSCPKCLRFIFWWSGSYAQLSKNWELSVIGECTWQRIRCYWLSLWYLPGLNFRIKDLKKYFAKTISKVPKPVIWGQKHITPLPPLPPFDAPTTAQAATVLGQFNTICCTGAVAALAVVSLGSPPQPQPPY